MNSVVLSRSAPDSRRFIARFLLLAIVSGATIGMAKLVTTLYALQMGATAAQVGIISSMESLGMALLTLPAGFLIARFGARAVYGIASVGPLLLNLVLPFTGAWYWIALTQLLIGFCIPFRVVSMNSAFLGELQRIGAAKAGWYRAALLVGMGLCGPFAANALSATLGYGWSFALVAASFGAMALFAQTFLPDEPAVAAGGGGALREIGSLLANVEVGESCLVEFVAAAARAAYVAFVVVIALQVLHLSQAEAVQLVMIDGVASVAALLGLGYLVRGVPLAWQYLASVVLAVAGLALLGVAADFAGFALGGVLLSAGASLIHLINMGQLSRHPAAKSKISSLFNTASMAGSFGGAMLGSALSAWIGLQHLFLAWIPAVLLLALWCWWRRRGALDAAGLASHALRLAHAALPIVLLLAAWELLAQSAWIPPQMLPTPQAVFLSGRELWDSGELQAHLQLSLGRLAAGFGAGAIAGVACGIALALSRNVRDFCAPLFELLRHLPTVALVPVFILMFGVGETLKILIVAKGVFFTVAVAVRDGVRDIPGAWYEVGALYKLRPLRLLLRLVLPAATPSMLTGLRTGLARSWMLLVLTEQLAAEQGIGQLMEFGRQMFRMDHVMLCIVLTAVIGFALDRLLQLVEHRLLKWRH